MIPSYKRREIESTFRREDLQEACSHRHMHVHGLYRVGVGSHLQRESGMLPWRMHNLTTVPKDWEMDQKHAEFWSLVQEWEEFPWVWNRQCVGLDSMKPGWEDWACLGQLTVGQRDEMALVRDREQWRFPAGKELNLTHRYMDFVGLF